MIALLGLCPCSGGGDRIDPLLAIAIMMGLFLAMVLVVGLFAIVKWLCSSWTRKGASAMNKLVRIGIVVVLLIAVGVVIAIKGGSSKPKAKQASDPASANSPGRESRTKLPRLVDLGAGKCIPCKMMAPILEELKKDYAGRFRVDFIDVWKNPDVGKEYGIRMIPTQIFYDGSGKERYRHEGFMSKEDILTIWKNLGIDLSIEGAANE